LVATLREGREPFSLRWVILVAAKTGHPRIQSGIFLRLLFFTNKWLAPLRAEGECLHA
jgi:hypothetical protein